MPQPETVTDEPQCVRDDLYNLFYGAPDATEVEDFCSTYIGGSPQQTSTTTVTINPTAVVSQTDSPLSADQRVGVISQRSTNGLMDHVSS